MKTLCRLLFAAALVFATPVQSQDFPSRPIKLVISSPPGGGTDTIGRLVADKIQDRLGQPVIVENRGGAAGNLAAEAVFKASPDGHTLFFTFQAPLVINKALYAKLSYEPELFVPVSLIATVPNVLIVHPKVEATNVQQLIALAKASPDRLNYASGGSGGPTHLTAEMFKSMAGVKIVGVPYHGSSPAAMAVLAGQTELMFVELITALPHIRAGKLRALAVTSEKRSRFLPDVPAMSEMLPGFVSSTWFGMVAPPKTPATIADKLSTVTAAGLKQPDLAKRLRDMSFEAVGSTPAELAKYMKEESKRWGDVVRMSGAPPL